MLSGLSSNQEKDKELTMQQPANASTRGARHDSQRCATACPMRTTRHILPSRLHALHKVTEKMHCCSHLAFASSAKSGFSRRNRFRYRNRFRGRKGVLQCSAPRRRNRFRSMGGLAIQLAGRHARSQSLRNCAVARVVWLLTCAQLWAAQRMHLGSARRGRRR